VAAALAALSALDLEVGPVLEALANPEPYRSVSEATPLTSGQRVLSLVLGEDDLPEDFEVELEVPAGALAGGVAVWWEAVLDTGLAWSNRPGLGGHWGQLVCGWSRACSGPLRVRFSIGEDGLEVMPL
jgi:hypothetical protein